MVFQIVGLFITLVVMIAVLVGAARRGVPPFMSAWLAISATATAAVAFIKMDALLLAPAGLMVLALLWCPPAAAEPPPDRQP